MRMLSSRRCRSASTFAAAAFASVTLASASLAHADFIGGADNFSGTTLDTSTWQSFSNGDGVVSQNNQLTLTTTTGDTDYTTKAFSVGIGQKVRTSFQLSTVGSNVGAFLSLVQGPVATRDWPAYANAFTLWGVDKGSGNVQFEFFNKRGGFKAGSVLPLQLNATYTYEIAFNSASSVTGNIYDSSDALLGTYTYSGLTGEPSSFLIDLSNQNCTVTFSSVTVSATPEPASLLLILSMCALLVQRKQQAAS
jgi:hypothetical protein